MVGYDDPSFFIEKPFNVRRIEQAVAQLLCPDRERCQIPLDIVAPSAGLYV